MTITLLANAGILINTGSIRLLVDGLYSDTGHTFSAIPPEVESRLFEGELGQVQYLLFTHLHPDHFDMYKTIEFTDTNKVRGVLLPRVDSMDAEMKVLILALRDNKTHALPLALKRGEQRYVAAGIDTEIVAFGTSHIGMQYRNVLNVCYLVKAGGKTLLITGDSDFDAADFVPVLDSGSIDAAIVNPLFMQVKQGAELMRRLSVDSVILCHIPFTGEDPNNLRGMALRQVKRYKDEAYNIMPLMEPMQSVSI
jgi:L-ascorbate metabolism protein UlaG (beta-lactamase superfamily)